MIYDDLQTELRHATCDYYGGKLGGGQVVTVLSVRVVMMRVSESVI